MILVKISTELVETILKTGYEIKGIHKCVDGLNGEKLVKVEFNGESDMPCVTLYFDDNKEVETEKLITWKYKI